MQNYYTPKSKHLTLTERRMIERWLQEGLSNRLTLSDLAYDDKGEAISQVSSQRDGGFILYYYAAGNQIPYWHFSITDSDPSDYGRDRLFTTQLGRFDYESTQQFVNSIFYKVSNNYSKGKF